MSAIRNPRELKPADLCRLLNSTPLGEVIDERLLYRQRSRAGFRIGSGKHVDLFRYTAWLGEQVHRPRPAQPSDPYAETKERARARSAAISLAGRDIGELPPIENLARRQATHGDFRRFCETYFPLTFHLSWSPDHLRVIAKIEEAVLHGGLFAMAMPRSAGKSSLAEVQRAVYGLETTRDMDPNGEEYKKASQRVRKAISKLRAAIEEGGAADHLLIVRGGNTVDPEYTLVLRFGASAHGK